MWGVKESSIFNSVLVVLKLAILLFFVIFALTKFEVSVSYDETDILVQL